MKSVSQQIRLSATDLSNHLACHHLTSLNLQVARGTLKSPDWLAPDAKTIQELGLRHEQRYLRHLKELGLDVRLIQNEHELGAVEDTLLLMQHGVDVIAQGAMTMRSWFGRPDILRKVNKPCTLGDWSYEVYDCKLARETKATAILQLALYSELLTQTQGTESEFMHVVVPGKGFDAETYRVSDYAAYYRLVKGRLEEACENERRETYPEPCTQCDICRWFKECDSKRRADDHLSLVASIRTQQRTQFEEWNAGTMAQLAVLPIPLDQKPRHGSRVGYERIREQARVQVHTREAGKLIYEMLPSLPESGFCKLPEPSAADMFVDLEGDPFAGDPQAGGGQEYLFGFAFLTETQELAYQGHWAFVAQEEKQGFEWLVDEIMRRWKATPSMHVYHFGCYEPGAFKRLMGRYATREDEVDGMLRAGIFIDLHQIFKQGVRAGVEEYSLKKLERIYNFVRKCPLDDARKAQTSIEHHLELAKDSDVPETYREMLETYNADDCYSTAALRDWLEIEREKLIASGTQIQRPAIGDGAPSEGLDERQKRIARLVEQLVHGIPIDSTGRTTAQNATWMVAQLLDWHRRENKATWWEGFRLAELDREQLMDERAGLAGLQFIERVTVERNIPVDRYSFEKQETEVRAEQDLYRRGNRLGAVQAIDLLKRTIDIKKTKKTAEDHPPDVYSWDRPVNVEGHANSLLKLGEWVRDNGIDGNGKYRAARDLLLRKPPRLSTDEIFNSGIGEEPITQACRTATLLDSSVFAIQGPPGAGKTFTGAQMICDLVRQGKKVGVTALSHKVIRNLLERVVDAAKVQKLGPLRCIQRSNDAETTEEITVAGDNDSALMALRTSHANVAGGTSWLWTAEAAQEAVDVLVIDEAGQMALADVVALAQAAKNLVLIGDPQQLERPLKGSHPEGAEKSALQYLIGDRKTIAPTMGLLLPETWRMHPNICRYTSEVFYESRLAARPNTVGRVLQSNHLIKGAGLWFLPVEHRGNRNSSSEEVEAIAAICEGLLSAEVRLQVNENEGRPLEWNDILIVAPYNAQVADLAARLPSARIGTVDKFQGQEAAVVIYSLTTSSSDEAPRGMEFLYSLNRLNVATSRAQTSVILVGSPKLFEPDCRSPRQMQLANALCRYLELASIL
jgi:predicted RecB family nuclease